MYYWRPIALNFVKSLDFYPNFHRERAKYARIANVNEPPRVLQVLQIIRKRRARRAAARNAFARRGLRVGGWVLAAASIAAALVAIAALPFYAFVTSNLPAVDTLDVLLNPEDGALLQPTQLFDRSGEHVLLRLEPSNAPRKFVAATDSPLLSAAFVASSDPGFWQHNGTIWTSTATANTIAERVVSAMLLADEEDGWLKTLRTRILASQVTSRFGRSQVLTWAINSARFGNWTFGAGSAARFYFGKDASQLTLAEAALLAAVAQAPDINPLDAPEAAQQLGHLVLIAMHEQRQISDDAFNLAINEQVVVTARSEENQSGFLQLALTQLEGAIGAARLERGALSITTTLDFGIQQELAALVGDGTVVVLDPLNGRVLAMTATALQPQPVDGLLTPFIYLDAFANGYAPASLVWNLGQQASNDSSLLGPVSMRAALANNLGQPVAAQLQELGALHVGRVLEAAGLSEFTSSTSEADVAQLILGSANASALEVAGAYSMLSNSGSYTGRIINGNLQPSALLFASDAAGSIVLDWSIPEQRSVAGAGLAFLVTDALSDISVRPSDQRDLLAALGRPAALQAGTEPNWIVGYSPQRVVVLQGTDDPELWAQAFQVAHTNLPIQSWQAPGNLSSVMVCVPSGQLPNGDCPETRREYFPNGSEPRFADELYIRLAINSLNGKLATVFTPEEFVQERIFLNVPENLQPLARAADLALAPEEYDTIAVIDQESGVEISSPARFSQVNSIVTIRGTLPDGFLNWDLQIGAGLYPAEWQQIATGSGRAVQTSWDANELSGLWAIQLQAWDEAGNVQRAFSIVTIGG